MSLLLKNMKIDFIGNWKIASIFSLALILTAVAVWVNTGDLRYGIDYKGGHEIIVKVASDVSASDLRRALNQSSFQGFVVQQFEAGSNEFAIRLSGESDASKVVLDRLQTALKAVYEGKFEVVSSSFIGPTVGQELRRQALIAIVLGLIGMLSYIAYRFEFAFALGAVVALVHDVIVCMGVYLYLGHQLNMASLAAFLTVVGYSVNDTIVIFDRVREELLRDRNSTLLEIFNASINATLSRTFITSLLTLFSAGALLIFGGGAIQDLSLLLCAGVIVGTYSSLFIASPVALGWEHFRRSRSDQVAA